MKIGFLGVGAWGFALASLLASKGYSLVCWLRKEELARQLALTREHPKLPGHRSAGDMTFTDDLAEALDDVDLIVEAVTSKGIRSVFEQINTIKGVPQCPIVVTSKGIEQGSGLILPEVIVAVYGEAARKWVGALSGPSFAHDVIRGLPTSVVATGYNQAVIDCICSTFTKETFRLYPNRDVKGVAFGGAMKNLIAIACGFCDGLALGYSCNAALMTRGLHEIRKVAVACGCRVETFYGLSGMGDLCLTCNSIMSRNYRFGHLVAEGRTPEAAQKEIGMVVEGVYTCVSAMELSREHDIPMPITESVYSILYQGVDPATVVKQLMSRAIKEEHL